MKKVDPKTGAIYEIDKSLDIVKTVKTTSGKVEMLKNSTFNFSSIN